MPRHRTTAEKPPPLSEAELCAEFISFARERGWTAYAETGGWDIVLVRDGIQIGVQAKKHFNATLLRQTIPRRHTYRSDAGPNYRAVLLPRIDSDIRAVCDFCGIVVFDLRPGLPISFWPPHFEIDEWPEWHHAKPIELPEYIPDVPAGASSPVRLTRWKIGALRITALLEIKGYVTRTDFATMHVDPRRWFLESWVLPMHLVKGKFVRGPKLNFDQQHPEVYRQIVAELREQEQKQSVPADS